MIEAIIAICVTLTAIGLYNEAAEQEKLRQLKEKRIKNCLKHKYPNTCVIEAPRDE
jgi:hypothetical protein